MPSPVDPSRRTALANDLANAGLHGNALLVGSGELSDLQQIAATVVEFGPRGRRERLLSAIKAGEYGPYQEEGGDGPAD